MAGAGGLTGWVSLGVLAWRVPPDAAMGRSRRRVDPPGWGAFSSNPPVPHTGSNAGPPLWLARGRDDNVVPALSLSPVSSSDVVPELLL